MWVIALCFGLPGGIVAHQRRTRPSAIRSVICLRVLGESLSVLGETETCQSRRCRKGRSQQGIAFEIAFKAVPLSNLSGTMFRPVISPETAWQCFQTKTPRSTSSTKARIWSWKQGKCTTHRTNRAGWGTAAWSRALTHLHQLPLVVSWFTKVFHPL